MHFPVHFSWSSLMREFWTLFLQILEVHCFSSMLSVGAAQELAPFLALRQHSFNRSQTANAESQK